MAKKSVCVSFDFEHEHYYYELLKAWDKNTNFEFTFSNCTSKEMQTESAGNKQRIGRGQLHDCDYWCLFR